MKQERRQGEEMRGGGGTQDRKQEERRGALNWETLNIRRIYRTIDLKNFR